jgi:hypothetical protein
VDILLRLCWALPLVLLAGLVIMLLLRHVVLPRPVHDRPRRLSLCESMTLSDEMRVHLIEANGTAYLITESARMSSIHPAPSVQAGQPQRVRAGAIAAPLARLLRRPST